MKKFLRGKIALEKAGDRITVVASDETLDRHGDVLPIENWDLTKFLGSPRMLVDHNHQVASIVGRWGNVRIEGKQLKMDAEFHEFTDLAKAVKEMVENDFLDTVSVGFIHHGPREDGGSDSFELIETSWVTVPANPSARVQASMKAALATAPSAEAIEKIKDFAGETDEAEEEAPVAVDPEEPAVEGEEAEEAEADEPVLNEDGTVADLPQAPDELAAEVDSVEEFRRWEAKGLASVTCSTPFVGRLILDSEKLKALTGDDEKSKVVGSRKAKILHQAMKELAHILNAGLKRANEADRQ